MSNRLSSNSNIVHNIEFESGILKIQNNVLESMTQREKEVTECFRLESQQPQSSLSYRVESTSLVERALKNENVT